MNAQHWGPGGRIANTAGDSVLAEFGSAVEAVQCAVEAQTALAEANSGLAPDRRISFRIGIHIGDVMVRAGDLFGDGVNIAARLQTLAKPGGVWISGATYDQVHKVLPITFGPWCSPSEEHSNYCRYSITSSAISRIDGGAARPRAFAVLRLTTIKYFIGN